MNIPGFTAAGSLYRTNGHYRRTGVRFNSGVFVVPATCSQDFCGECINGRQRCCEKGGYPHWEPCEDLPPVTCDPCFPPPVIRIAVKIPEYSYAIILMAQLLHNLVDFASLPLYGGHKLRMMLSV